MEIDQIATLERFKDLIKARTDTELAVKLEINKNTIAAWRNRKIVDLGALVKYAWSHHLDLNEIFYGDQNPFTKGPISFDDLRREAIIAGLQGLGKSRDQAEMEYNKKLIKDVFEQYDPNDEAQNEKKATPADFTPLNQRDAIIDSQIKDLKNHNTFQELQIKEFKEAQEHTSRRVDKLTKKLSDLEEKYTALIKSLVEQRDKLGY